MKRIPAFDVLRTLAILFVVAIHSCARLNSTMAVEANQFGIMHFCGALWHIIYIAVPLFVMLSGTLLLGKDEPIGEFFKKRFKRVLIPFLVWSVILGVFLFYKENKTLAGCLRWIVESTLTGGVHNIYWYIYLILGLYLATPLLWKITLNSSNVVKLYFSVLLLVVYLFGRHVPSMQLFHRFLSDNILFMFYFVAGDVIYENIERIKPFFKWLPVLCVLIYLAGAFCFVLGQSVELITITEALFIFTLIVALPFQFGSKAQKGFELVSGMSYGIYLTHFAIISFLSNVAFLQQIHAAVYPMVSVAIVLLLDMAMLQLLKKIGFGKWVM